MSRQCIIGMLSVAGCVVKEEESLRMSLCALLKDIDCVIHLGKQVIGCEPAVPSLPSPEYYPGFTVEE